MKKATKFFSTATWIAVRALLLLAFVAVIRPTANEKAISGQAGPETTLFFTKENKQTRAEATGLHQRLQKARHRLEKKGKISEDQLLKQMPIEQLKETFDKGEILWAPTEGGKYRETEQFKRKTEEEGRTKVARLREKKQKEDKIKILFWVGILTLSPALIFATLAAIIRPKPRERGRRVGLQAEGQNTLTSD
jgi:hypothetical protein